jgi:hypothetical protein
MLPLSNLSSISNDSLAIILNKDKSILTNSIYSCSGDEYRQCRRIRNIAIFNQQKKNPNENSSSHQNLHNSINETSNNRPRRSILNLWHTVRLLQIGIRHRRKTDQYVQQINTPESDDRQTTISAGGLQTIDENENIYQRANIEIAESTLNELPVAVPIVSQPTFISLTTTDQEDESDATPVTGQRLCKSGFCFYPGRKILFVLFYQYILQQNYLIMKMLFVFLLVKMLI